MTDIKNEKGSSGSLTVNQEHPDSQMTVRSTISHRSLHNHEAIQLSDLLVDNSIEEEHKSTQVTVRSAQEFMDKFQQNNVEAIELAWNDLTVTASEGEKTLLTGASGKVQASFLAIMGPSGSGKTTLMNVLACRANGVDSDGTRVINGVSYSLSELKQIAGYVMQDDLLNGRLTVEETLWYTAELRLPSTMTAAQKQERIEEVMAKLGLTRVRNVIIGDPLKRGISGGERKRVAVAMELLTRPRLLFLDEPTSGLDSVTAASLCELLRDLAHSGACTVITTIHQPQSKIFRMFDDLLLLKSGRIVYYGPADQIMEFFSEAGFPCPPMTNPADHMLDVITANPSQEGSKEAVEEAERRLKEVQEERIIKIEQQETTIVTKAVHGGQRASWFHQFMTLLRRSIKEQMRAKDIMFTLLFQNLLMAILIGTVFLNIGTGQSSIVRRQPFLFFCVINQGIFSALTMINSFPKERILVLRERAAGTYFASAYFLAKNIAELLSQIFAPVLFSVIVYFLVGLQMNVAKFFIFTIFLVLGSVAATSFALMVSTIAKTTDMAVTILPMVLEVSRLFGGFFLSPANLPAYFSWLDALSYVKYTYTALSLNELSGLVLTCTEAETASGKCITNGETIIKNNGFDFITLGGCAGALIAFIIGTRVIAYLGLRYLK